MINILEPMENEFVKSMFVQCAIDFLKSAAKKSLKLFIKRKYLNYDYRWLIEQYKNVRPIAPLIPYSELISWLGKSSIETFNLKNRIKVNRIPERFSLGDDGKYFIRAFQGQAMGALIEDGKMTSNDEVVRLASLERNGGNIVFNIQKAHYADQAQSNLVMDWEGPHALSKVGGVNSLRAYLSAKHSRNLPPLNEPLLANSLGISIIVLYREGRNLIPYMPLRVGDKPKEKLKKTGRSHKKVAVFEGGYHCTASGAVEWNSNRNFSSLFIEDLYRELYEEVGLEKKHIETLMPVALCREFLRAGKPQIFCVGITNRTKSELEELRLRAIERTLNLKLPPEIHRKIYLWSDEQEARELISEKGITLEAAGNLFYVDKFISQYS